MSPLVLACGWISILGSLVLKVPQIVAVCRAWSVRGLSLQSLLLELTGFSINFAYNAAHGYPLDSYGEYLLLIPQDVLLLLLMLHLTDRLTAGWLAALAAAGVAVAAVASGAAPLQLARLLICMALPLGWSSKIVQLKTIMATEDARSLSVTTWMLAALTCATRIVTTLAETQDSTLLTCFTVNLLLNLLVIGAAVLHRHGPMPDSVRKEQ